MKCFHEMVTAEYDSIREQQSADGMALRFLFDFVRGDPRLRREGVEAVAGGTTSFAVVCGEITVCGVSVENGMIAVVPAERQGAETFSDREAAVKRVAHLVARVLFNGSETRLSNPVPA